MTFRLVHVGFCASLLVAGCASMPSIPLQATPADLELLAGKWTGEYESPALGRHGSIEFSLQSGTDDARGDVVMVPAGRSLPYQRYEYPDVPHTPDSIASEMLTIRFIRSSNGSLVGMLDRYWDPDRSCFANTTFSGNIGRGVVEGTFNTRFECGAGEATGTWSAKKKASKPNDTWR